MSSIRIRGSINFGIFFVLAILVILLPSSLAYGQPALIIDFNASDSGNTQSVLTWTNPPDPSLAEVVVRRKIGSYPTNNSDGVLVFQDVTPLQGKQSVLDSGLVNDTTYFYAVYSSDNTGNWNDTTTQGLNGDRGVPSGFLYMHTYLDFPTGRQGFMTALDTATGNLNWTTMPSIGLATDGVDIAGTNDSEPGPDADFPPGKKFGYKWEDIDFNGIWDAGEPPLASWTVILRDYAGNWVGEMQTDSRGYYEFSGLEPGAYTVEEVLLPGWNQTFPPGGKYTFTIPTSNQELEDGLNNFGNQRLGTKFGYKWEDINGDGDWDAGEPPLAGWTIWIEGWVVVAPGPIFGQFGPIATVTDADGFYWFDELPCGGYEVWEDIQPGWVVTSPPGGMHFFTITSGSVDGPNDFGNKPNKKSGHKWEDTDGDGVWDWDELPLEGWEIILEDWLGFEIDRTTTDASGYYEFKGIPPGDYQVEEVLKPGWIQTFPGGLGFHAFTIDDGQELTDNDFGNKRIPLGYAFGFKWEDKDGDGVWDPDEPPLKDWEIVLRDSREHEIARTTTDEIGFYEFAGLAPDDYMVMETQQSGWVQTFPPSKLHEFTIEEDSLEGPNNFGNARPGHTEGWKWEDRNGNGVWDSGEPPLAGWEILLKDKDGNVIARQTTNANGNYQFKNLPPGEYVIEEVSKAGWEQTFPSAPGSHSIKIFSGAWIYPYNFGNKTDLRGTIIGGEGHYDQEEKSITVPIPGHGFFFMTLRNNASAPLAYHYRVEWIDQPEDVTYWAWPEPYPQLLPGQETQEFLPLFYVGPGARPGKYQFRIIMADQAGKEYEVDPFLILTSPYPTTGHNTNLLALSAIFAMIAGAYFILKHKGKFPERSQQHNTRRNYRG